MRDELDPPANSDQTPPDCWQLDELTVLQSFDHQTLAEVNYYLWRHIDSTKAGVHQFLYFL